MADADGHVGNLAVENTTHVYHTGAYEQPKGWRQRMVQFYKNYMIELIGVIASVIGLTLLLTYTANKIPGWCKEECIKTDYTSCTNSDDVSKTCAVTLEDKSQTECICYVGFNVTSLLKGNITMYYQLNYNQSIYANSKDVDQLRGILSPKPSSNCGDHTYTPQGKPIAPCGELADTMFTDTFDLIKNNDFVDSVTTGLIDANTKQRYRNPKGNLTEVLKDYAKPLSWLRNIWELDTINPENNGFQNEAFIAWMETGLLRKPVCRLNQTSCVYTDGLPVGEFKWKISYRYPPRRYNGTRLLLICGEVCHPEINLDSIGITLLLSFVIVIGLIAIVFRPISRMCRRHEY